MECLLVENEEGDQGSDGYIMYKNLKRVNVRLVSKQIEIEAKAYLGLKVGGQVKGNHNVNNCNTSVTE